jgi:hypothetical protein
VDVPCVTAGDAGLHGRGSVEAADDDVVVGRGVWKPGHQ